MSPDTPSSPPIKTEDLHAYVDNRVDPTRRQEIQEYLDRHPESAQQVSAFTAQRQALRSALAAIADEPIPARLDVARMVSDRRVANPWQWRLAASIVLAFGLGGFTGWSARPLGPGTPSAGIAALAQEATVSYAVYASDPVRPVEIGPEQQSELVSWISSRLHRQIAIPDLTKSGYRFLGGRLVSTDHGPAGMFVYDGPNGTRLATLVRPMSIERDTPMMKRTDGDVAGFTWATRGLGYSVVATQRAEVLHPVADEVRRQFASIL